MRRRIKEEEDTLNTDEEMETIAGGGESEKVESWR